MDKINKSSEIIKEERKIQNYKNRVETQIGCPNCRMWIDITNVFSTDSLDIELQETSDKKILVDYYIICPYCSAEINFAWNIKK